MQKSLSLLGTRQKLGLTQARIADLLGITPEYVSMIEHGKKIPSRKILNKLVKLLDETTEGKEPVPDQRRAVLYDQPHEQAPPLIVSESAHDFLKKENESLRSELREARAVIRQLSATLESLTTKTASEKP